MQNSPDRVKKRELLLPGHQNWTDILPTSPVAGLHLFFNLYLFIGPFKST